MALPAGFIPHRAVVLLTLVVAWVGLLVSCGNDSKDAPAGKKTETQWVDPTQLRHGPVRHEALSEQQRLRIRRLHKVFAEVDSSSLEKWENDFKRDLDPDRELSVWEAMASAYESYCTNRVLSADAKREVYSITLLRSGASEPEVMKHLKLKTLSVDEARSVMKGFDAPPKPITINK